jgi:type I restriction enzyme S subunit
VSWVRTRLKFLSAAPIRNGLGESGQQDDPSWPRYIRTTDIAGPRKLRDDVFASLPPDVAREAMLEPGDIVMTAAGTIGKSFLYNSSEPACYAGYLVRFRPKRDVDPRFVAYWTESSPYWAQIETGKVMSTIENFSASKYQNLVISIPNLPVQRSIADYLDRETARIDALIEKKRSIIERLSERRQALITSAVQGEIGPGAARGDGVSWRKLKHYCDGPPEYGLNVSSDEYVDEGLRLLRTTDIDDSGSLSPESEGVFVDRSLVDARYVLEPGDLLFSRAGSLGRSFRVPSEARGLTFAGYLVRFRPLPIFESRYLQYCVSAAFTQASITAEAITSTISNFNAARYGNLLIPYIDPEGQRAIADFLDRETARIDALIEKIDRQIDLLLEHRQALITAAVTGELDIPGVAA